MKSGDEREKQIRRREVSDRTARRRRAACACRETAHQVCGKMFGARANWPAGQGEPRQEADPKFAECWPPGQGVPARRRRRGVQSGGWMERMSAGETTGLVRCVVGKACCAYFAQRERCSYSHVVLPGVGLKVLAGQAAPARKRRVRVKKRDGQATKRVTQAMRRTGHARCAQ